MEDDNEDYPMALKSVVSRPYQTEIKTLSRFQSKILKCLNNPRDIQLFPRNPSFSEMKRASEPFIVNFVKTSTYKKLAIPFCQNMLNKHFSKQK